MKKLLLLLCIIGISLFAHPKIKRLKKRKSRRTYHIPLNDTPHPTHEAHLLHQEDAQQPIGEPPHELYRAPQEEESSFESSIQKALTTAACIILIDFVLNYDSLGRYFSR